MKNGDISNREAPYVGFDIDTLLYLEEDKKSFALTLVDRIRESFRDSFTNYTKRELNPAFKRDIRWLWDTENVSIVFLSQEMQDIDDLNKLSVKLDDEYWIPYTKLYSYPDRDELRNLLRSGQLHAFFSADEELISYCSHNNAKHFRELKEFFS